MLTAAKAREISKNVAKEDVTKIEIEVKRYVKGILVGVKENAERGYCRDILNLVNYPRNMRMPIVHMLEDLGYKVQLETWFTDLYIISW
jgi:hypothetical protein